MTRVAILHVPHEQCEESMREMLSSIGYRVYGIGRDVAHQVNPYMIPQVASRIQPQANLETFNNCDLFVTVKHYNIPKAYDRHPHLKGKILWFDINGGIPGVYIAKDPKKTYPFEVPVPYVSANKHYADGNGYAVSGPRYVCYIPLARRQEFLAAAHHRTTRFDDPVCLVYDPYHWGYGWVVDPLHEQRGVRFFGGHKAPNGILRPREVSAVLTNAMCLVHAKSHDCPGCALYESLLVGCPVIITDVFLATVLYTDLYEHGETCLVVNDDYSLPFPARQDHLVGQFVEAIDRLKNPKENVRIGSNGRKRLAKLMWQSERENDVNSFRKFMREHFG